MSFFSDLLGGLANSLLNSNDAANDLDCDWYCDECGEYMNDQPGFTVKRGTWKCKSCGAVNDVSEDNIRYEEDNDYDSDDDDDDDDDDYTYGYGSDDDDDYIPEGCRACGGPYPNCKTSCPLFDD